MMSGVDVGTVSEIKLRGYLDLYATAGFLTATANRYVGFLSFA
jgi:hypothetical protein